MQSVESSITLSALVVKDSLEHQGAETSNTHI